FRRWTEQRLSAPSPALSRAFARLAGRAERDGGEPLDELRKAAWNLTEWRDFDAPWDKRPFAGDAHMAALIDTAEATLRIPSRGGRAQEDFRPLREFVLRVQRAREAGRVDAATLESELLRLPNEMRWVRGRDALYAGWEELKLAIEAFRQPADADLAARATSSGKWWASISRRSSAPGSSISWTCCCARATCCGTTERAPIWHASTSGPSSTNSRTPTRCRPKFCSCWPLGTPPSAIGARRGRRPESSTWWATPNNPSTDSAAPTPGSSNASARGCAAMAWVRARSPSARDRRWRFRASSTPPSNTAPRTICRWRAVSRAPKVSPALSRCPCHTLTARAIFPTSRLTPARPTRWRPSFNGSARRAAGRCATARRGPGWACVRSP